MLTRSKLFKFIALFTATNLLYSLFFPTIALALTSGPNAPEFSSFEPVATTDMVNIFSGDFTYNLPVVNIPGPDGGGYAMSLSYHSGVSSEEEASWVGFGWSLNPGAINRQKRGLPDDYKKANVTKYNKTRPNWTIGAKLDVGLEIMSWDLSENPNSEGAYSEDNSKFTPSLSYSTSMRFNNYRGFTKTVGYGLGVKGIGDLSLTKTGGQSKLSISIGQLLGSLENELAGGSKDIPVYEKDFEAKENEKTVTKTSSIGVKQKSKTSQVLNTVNYAAMSIAGNTIPVSINAYRGISYEQSLSVQINPVIVPIGIELGATASFTMQTSIAKENKEAYGYMYNPSIDDHEKSVEVFDVDKILSDYTMEKPSTYNKRDKFLSIPHNGADNFILTGEGLTGGFRLYHDTIGHYYPSFIKNSETFAKMGLEVGVGLDLSIGFDIRVGSHTTKITDWKHTGDANNEGYKFNKEDKGFFRFTNDLGGNIEYVPGDDVISASIGSGDSGGMPGLRVVRPSLNGVLKLSDYNKRRSSFIDFNIVSEINDEAKNDNRFEKSSDIVSLSISPDTQGDDSEYKDVLGEFSIINEVGLNYVYGLPLYVRNEKTLNIDVEQELADEANYLAYKKTYVGKNVMDNRVVIGESSPKPYASNYLLTQITTPNYIDLGNNGPGEEDFGGWTKFSYRQWSASDENNWYRFRTPYSGLLYSKNKNIDKKDNTGVVISGEKQKYYLKTVETKTHVAFFITNKTVPSDFIDVTGTEIENLEGSGKTRYDGVGAPREIAGSGDDLDYDPASEKGTDGKAIKDETQEVEMLEKIVIFSKSDFEKPLQTVHFDYDFSLCKGLPNSTLTPTNYTNSGKLTLKKVWFESQGIVNSKIAPYEFVYNYQKQYKDEIIERYPAISEYASNPTLELDDQEQNPDYDPWALDMWGNYQQDGKARKIRQNPWVYQGSKVDKDYDPAAWNLKKIILPSGGEVHVQYEQKDYQYVQDEKALAMVSLLPVTNDSYKSEDGKFYLNLEDLGYDPDNDDIGDYVNILRDYFIPKEGSMPPHQVYYKFLYAIHGNGIADINNCWSEYISGYTFVNKVEIDDEGIYLQLGADRDWFSWFGDIFSEPNQSNMPKTICYDMAVFEADGFLKGNNCDCEFDRLNSIDNEILDVYEGLIKEDGDYNIWSDFDRRIQVRRNIATPALKEIDDHITRKVPSKGSVCKDLSDKNSYLRVPLIHDKKGGGIRVKRLMMYDEGLETGDANLFGSEYKYKLTDGTSSGVATNEPAAGREENALVQLLDRKDQTALSRVVSGEDMKQSEGPLGEELLPGASIGYSRIIVESINTNKKTSTGYTVHDYYTAKDFPLKVDYSKLSDDEKKQRDWISIFAGLFSYSVDKYWLTQGYKFIIQNMHGQVRKVSNYAGSYDSKENYGALVSYNEYEYFDFEKEGIDLLKYDINQNKFVLENDQKPGKEEDVTMEMRRVTDQTLDLSIELDISIGLCVPPPVSVGFGLSFLYDEKALSTHVTNRVIRYPVIVKSITNFVDGGLSKTENLAFNPENGSPVVTKTYDSFDKLNLEKGVGTNGHHGAYYTWNIPASWMYPQLGQIAAAPDGEYRSNRLNEMAGSIVSYGETGNWLEKKFDTDNNWDPNVNTPEGVLSGNVITYKNNWFSNGEQDEVLAEFNLNRTDDQFVIEKLNNFYRAKSNYVYTTDLSNMTSANNDENRIYNGGLISNFNMFDHWDEQNVPEEWLKMSEITAYSPNGQPLEERNVLGIYSSVKYGYANLLPVLVAQNAEYESVYFNDFENFEDAVMQYSHSGKASFNYTANPDFEFVDGNSGISFTDQIINNGLRVMVWAKSMNEEDPIFENAGSNFSVNINNNIEVPFVQIAKTGDWDLYEAQISDWGSTISSGDQVSLKLKYNLEPGEQLLIDDFRFQPLDASAVCSVYDVKNFKLLAQFDDQHFGMYYQYNAEGKLVRKLVETERGIKTIQETQYNSPLVGRNDD